MARIMKWTEAGLQSLRDSCRARARAVSVRILENIEIVPWSGCWIWMLGLDKHGYGAIRAAGRMRAAHIISYQVFEGEIPSGLELDHLCRVRCCINPAHLEPVTRRTNVLRGIGPTAENAKKTHCSKGHAFDESNTYMRTDGGRHCRTCGRATVAAYLLRKKTSEVRPA